MAGDFEENEKESSLFAETVAHLCRSFTKCERSSISDTRPRLPHVDGGSRRRGPRHTTPAVNLAGGWSPAIVELAIRDAARLDTRGRAFLRGGEPSPL